MTSGKRPFNGWTTKWTDVGETGCFSSCGQLPVGWLTTTTIISLASAAPATVTTTDRQCWRPSFCWFLLWASLHDKRMMDQRNGRTDVKTVTVLRGTSRKTREKLKQAGGQRRAVALSVDRFVIIIIIMCNLKDQELKSTSMHWTVPLSIRSQPGPSLVRCLENEINWAACRQRRREWIGW